MKFKTLTQIIIFSFFCSVYVFAQSSNPFTVDLARAFSKDIFELNGLPYLQPVVRVVNSTSNAGFFYNSYIPKNSKTPYFKFTIQMMYGVVPQSEKTYSPSMPAKEFNSEDVYKYVNILTGKIDTAGLIHYFFLNLMYDGIYGNHKGIIQVPKSAPTALGNQKTDFELRKSALDTLVRAHPAYALVKQYGLEDTLMSTIANFPDVFHLPPGGDINNIVAGIPQIVIGSYFGTELLLRYVPTINLGSNIGDFNFWGLGIKHSISQYFDMPFDCSFQAVYQRTKLSNNIGVTNANLKAEAQIVNLNLQLSKNFNDFVTLYSSVSNDIINIKSTYKYYLPVEMQWQLKLLDQFAKDNNGNYLSVDKDGIPNNSKPTPGFPGDQFPQTAIVDLKDNQFRFTIGLSKEIYNFIIAVDYNFSKVPVLGGAVGFKF